MCKGGAKTPSRDRTEHQPTWLCCRSSWTSPASARATGSWGSAPRPSSSTLWARWPGRWAWAASRSRSPWPTRRTGWRTVAVCLLHPAGSAAGAGYQPGLPSPALPRVAGPDPRVTRLLLNLSTAGPPGRAWAASPPLAVRARLLQQPRPRLGQTTLPTTNTTNSTLRE